MIETLVTCSHGRRLSARGRCRVTLHQLRARCEDLLRALDPPQPLTVESLAAHVSALRGRPITVLPMPATLGASGDLCGLWAATDTRDVIYVIQDTRPSHQLNCTMHELAHIVCDHSAQLEMTEEDMATLVPTLGVDLVRMMLGRRDGFAAQQEQEAEMLASLLVLAHEPPVSSAGRRQQATEALNRAQRVLGL